MQYFDTIIVGVGEIDLAVQETYCLYVLQEYLVADAVDIAKVEKAATNQGCDLLWARERNGPYRAGFAVGHIQDAAIIKRQTIGLSKERLLIAAIA